MTMWLEAPKSSSMVRELDVVTVASQVKIQCEKHVAMEGEERNYVHEKGNRSTVDRVMDKIMHCVLELCNLKKEEEY